MSKVLFLYTQADQERSEEFKDVLQVKLGSSVNVVNVCDVLADDSTLEDELFQSRCVLLIYTQDSERHLLNGSIDFDEDYVLFDGSIIKAFLEQDEVVHKVIIAHFGWRPDKWLYDRVHKRIFHVSETLDLRNNPKIDQIVDALKGLIKKKKQ